MSVGSAFNYRRAVQRHGSRPITPVMRSRMNAWIFSTVFGIVVSLPLIIPGCTPISGTGGLDQLLGAAGGSQMLSASAQLVQPLLDTANQNAAVANRATTLQDVLDENSIAGLVGVTFTASASETVTATFSAMSGTCTIRIVSGTATATC
jgi:predicted phage tail protein